MLPITALSGCFLLWLRSLPNPTLPTVLREMAISIHLHPVLPPWAPGLQVLLLPTGVGRQAYTLLLDLHIHV